MIYRVRMNIISPNARDRPTSRISTVSGERLRIVGRLVNAKGGELVHLTKTLNSVSFQYRDKDGVLQSEEYSADDLFRIQQQYSSEREN